MNEYIKFSFPPPDPELEKKLKENMEKFEKYETNYVPSLSSIGFEEGKLEKPEKWQPQEHQKEQQLVNKAKFSTKEMIEEAIDDKGNIKNGSKFFRKLFYDKISLILGEQFAENCIDNNYYIPWKEGEMQNDLSKFINDNQVIKKDIEKIIAIRFIGDMVSDLVDEEGEPHVNPFVSNSLISRFKNNNTSILEKYFIKDIIYEIINLENYSSYNYGSFYNKEKKDKTFLKKEIGANFYPKKYHDKSFNKFEFQFNENQEGVIFHYGGRWSDEEIKPVNYYKDNNIKVSSSYYVGEYGAECYISSSVAPGIVGIYSKDGVLVGWKNITGLKEGQSNTLNDTFELKNENRMISKEDLALFKVSSSLGFRDYIQKMLAVDLSTSDIKTQFYFLNFIQGKTEEELKEFKEFVRKSKNEEEKVNKLKTFLSIGQGGKEMGDKILALGEKLPEDVAKNVFSKYGEIVDVADNIEETLKEILPENVVNESQNEIKEIRESLFVRAKDLLVTFYDKKEKNDVDLLNDLDRYKAEILLYADTYKKLKESGKDITLEDIKNTQITILSQEEKEKMAKNFWNITKANRPFIVEGSEEMKNREKNFNLTIENKDSDFYVLKYKDNIIAFCSFTPDKNGDLYIESLNTESEAKGSHIGSEFLPSVLEKTKKSGRDIYGHVHARNSGTLPYYERLGFNVNPVEENGELKYYEIRIKAQQKQEKTSMAA